MYEWGRQVKEGGEANLLPRGRPKAGQGGNPAGGVNRCITDLRRTIARQELVIEFFKRCIAALRSSVRAERRNADKRIFESIAAMQGRLSVEAMCRWAGVSRSGFYRYLRTAIAVKPE